MRNPHRPTTAMVLAAGMGTRMRPLTDQVPKPLVTLDGRALLDHALDRISAAGLDRAVVNVHYKADLIERHLAARTAPQIIISDERNCLLETGGGIAKALPVLGEAPFLVHNSDSVWIEYGRSALNDLLDGFDENNTDFLMLLAGRTSSLGYDGGGDFHRGSDGRLTRPGPGAAAPFVFTGVSVAHPRAFAGAPAGPFSLNVLWDRAMANGRMHGMVLDGQWMHVGTPEALRQAEDAISQRAAQQDGKV
jgi:N-acetyl-alpha-D-muramate 1-phosphate uridylyltransferase